MGAPCVLVSLGASDPEARQHHRKGHRHTRTLRVAVTVRPAASRAVALNVCLPLRTLLVFQSFAKRSEVPVFAEPITCLPSANVTDFTFFVELATTSSRTALRRHVPDSGASQVTAGCVTTTIFAGLKFVFGRMFVPIVLTFFVS